MWVEEDVGRICGGEPTEKDQRRGGGGAQWMGKDEKGTKTGSGEHHGRN